MIREVLGLAVDSVAGLVVWLVVGSVVRSAVGSVMRSVVGSAVGSAVWSVVGSLHRVEFFSDVSLIIREILKLWGCLISALSSGWFWVKKI